MGNSRRDERLANLEQRGPRSGIALILKLQLKLQLKLSVRVLVTPVLYPGTPGLLLTSFYFLLLFAHELELIIMFFDWLTIYQDHDTDHPILSDRFSIVLDSETGEAIGRHQPSIQHPGSYCTSIQVRVSGGRITVSGNPSRYNRLDNLFGFRSLDDCVAIYNHVLRELGLPEFTRCTTVYQRQSGANGRTETFSDGAIVTEVHCTRNRSVGAGNADAYLSGLSTLRYRNSIPRLHTNGRTVDWLSPQGRASLIYASVYQKAHEMILHSRDKIRRNYGSDSNEYRDFQRVVGYCDSHGVVRFELKFKSAYLRREGLRYWGLSDFSVLSTVVDDFCNLDARLQVTAMDLETISDRLMGLGIVSSRQSANSTSLYALQWMSGQRFDLNKTQVQTHRARLRRIGIDIADRCDISRHSPVYVRRAVEVQVDDLPVPSWYQGPSTQPMLRLVS